MAARWQVSDTCIDNYRRDGILAPCKGIPAIRFSEQYIAGLEGIKLERFSPMERRRLEDELEEVKQERDLLKTIVRNNLMECSKIFNIKVKE